MVCGVFHTSLDIYDTEHVETMSTVKMEMSDSGRWLIWENIGGVYVVHAYFIQQTF